MTTQTNPQPPTLVDQLQDWSQLVEHITRHQAHLLIDPEPKSEVAVRLDAYRDPLHRTLELQCNWTFNGVSSKVSHTIPECHTMSANKETRNEALRSALQDLSEQIALSITHSLHDAMAKQVAPLISTRENYAFDAYR